MATVANIVYMAELPNGEARFAAGTVGIVIDLGVASHFWQVTYADYNPGFLITAQCVDKETIYMIISITNIVMDMVILLLPLKIVIPLQMARRQKASFILLFTTGTFVCASAIKRTIILPPLLKSADYNWDVAEQFNWSFLKANAGIVCASVPGLKPFFVRYLPSFISSRITGSNDKSGKKSLPYSTVIENNRKRRNLQSESYELQSHDDLPEGSSGKAGSSDDEAKLWSGRRYRKDIVSERETIIESEPKHHKRMCGGISHTANVVGSGGIEPASLAGRNDGRCTPSTAARIQVTHETKVSYDSQIQLATWSRELFCNYFATLT
ncbi:integral membrane protein [Colletotrichum salicis]|uniref:Integral membrane protein n=1 Tax=Colletotrichum salicis TaxID=1209931 RepID=A0A135UUW0_9PEZI|nr:integral membrane protein [Colletotrichum salicis]